MVNKESTSEERLDSILVKELKNAVSKMAKETGAKKAEKFVTIQFPLETIPEDLQSLLKARLSMLKGQISAQIGDGNGTYYFYLKEVQIIEKKVKVTFKKCW